MPCFGHGHCLVGILHTVPTLTVLQLFLECDIKRKMLDNVIGVTPAGFYCVKCGTPVGDTTSAIRSHLNRCQPGLKDDLGEAHMVTVHGVQILKDKVNSSRRLPVEQHACSPLQQKHRMYCSNCFVSFQNSRASKVHFDSPKNHCDIGMLQSGPCVKLKCGRFFPMLPRTSASVVSVSTSSLSTITHSNSSTSSSLSSGMGSFLEWNTLPDQFCVPKKTVENVLKGYVRDDEQVEDWAGMFHLLVANSGSSFENQMKKSVHDAQNTQIHDNEEDLRKLHESSDYFFEEHCTLVHSCPANIKARLQHFLLKDNGEEQTKLFSVRQTHQTLQREARMLLSYLFRSSNSILMQYIHVLKKDDYTVQKGYKLLLLPQIIIHLVLNETATGPVCIPDLYKYSLVLCFSTNNTNLKLKECGYAGQKLASLLYIIRVCAIAKSMAMETSMQLKFIESIQQSQTINLICPNLCHLRSMKGKKVVPVDHVVCTNGDIISMEFTYKKEVYQMLIPLLSDFLIQKLNSVMKECNIKEFISSNNIVFIRDWIKFDVVLVNNQTKKEIAISGFEINKDSDLGPYQFQMLTSHMGLALFGTGLGAGRMSQIENLKVNSTYVLGDCLYYTERSTKRGSYRARTGTNVLHKLCPLMTRIFFLCRHVKNAFGCEDDFLLARIENRTHYLPNAVKDIFGFSKDPPLLSVRHFFTSLSNSVFPSMTSGQILAIAEMTDKNHHQQNTAANHYQTNVQNWDEHAFDKWFEALGCTNPDSSNNLKYDSITAEDLHSSLQFLFGSNATWVSGQQERMVFAMARSRSRHIFISIPCGGGKTMAAVLPVVAEARTGRPIRKRIFCPNYSFLCEYHGYNITKLLNYFLTAYPSVSVEVFQGSDITEESLSSLLECKPDDLPEIMIMSTQAIHNLIHFYPTRIPFWVKSGWLVDIILDEVHTVYSELKFRASLLSLSSLSNHGIPITLMTGSMNKLLAGHLCKHLGVTEDIQMNDMEFIGGNDPVGTGFSFITVKDNNVLRRVVADVKQFVQIENRSVHVICTSKSDVDAVCAGVKKHDISVLHATSELSLEEKSAVAQKWSDGIMPVLVTTTMGLVGNENSKVDVIMIVNLMYDLSNTVQCIGRLRSSQRHAQSQVRQYVTPSACLLHGTNYDHDEENFETYHIKYVQIGLLSNEPNVKTAFRDLHSLNALKEVICSKGCVLVGMSRRYGWERSECGRCSFCVQSSSSDPQPPKFVTHLVPGTVPRLQAHIHKTKKRDQSSLSNMSNPYRKKPTADVTVSANWKTPTGTIVNPVAIRKQILDKQQCQNMVSKKVTLEHMHELLLKRCLICRDETCDGTKCMAVGKCYLCGGNHYRTNCPYSPNQPKGKSRLHMEQVCKECQISYCCFDKLLGESHLGGNCRFGKKIRRMLIQESLHKQLSFVKTISSVYATAATYELFLRKFYNVKVNEKKALIGKKR